MWAFGCASNIQPKNGFSVWATGFGEYAHQKAILQNPSFNYLSEGVLGGYDFNAGRNLIGACIGYAHTRYTEEGHFGHGNIDYYFAGIYGNMIKGEFYLSPGLYALFDKISNTRNISFPDFSATANADISGWQLIPHLEVGYDTRFLWGGITPFGAIDWSIAWQRGYHEHGANPFNARCEADSTSMMRSEVGLKFYRRWDYNWGTFCLGKKASYVFEKPFGTGDVNAAFVGMPGEFTVLAMDQNLNLGTIGLELLFAVGRKWPVTIDFDYEGAFGSQFWSNKLSLTISKNF